MGKIVQTLISYGQSVLLWLSIITRYDELRKKQYVARLGQKEIINVVFIATFSSQWKYDDLYRRFEHHPRFNPIIILIPMRHFEQAPDFANMRAHLQQEGFSYLDFMQVSEEEKNIRETLNPDILFYPQPYYHIYDKRVDSHSFKDKLICYSFYSFQDYALDWNYNLEFHERAWKIFHNTTCDLSMSKKYALNKGRNVVITGYLNADKYRYSRPVDVWKPQPVKKKRVIWSPHFSITPDSALYQGNFPVMAEMMVRLAEKYSKTVQFALKPHPNLLRQLYLHPEWGQEKADAYYQLWRDMPNTQIVDGTFYDLFLTSDGMINDSGSFTVEYLYTKNPAINCFRDINDTYQKMTYVGQKAVDIQYKMKDLADVERFVQEVIVEGKDEKNEERKDFYMEFLMPPDDAPVVDNIFNEICKSLGIV